MARIALDHLEFGAKRPRGEALLRIFNANEKEHGYTSNFTFVEMVNDDMPFLVDSVAAAINQQNLAVSVKRVNGGKLVAVTKADDAEAYSESFIRFAISRTTDEKVIKTLRKVIVKTLSDVRVAVRDWGKMRQRMRETNTLRSWATASTRCQSAANRPFSRWSRVVVWAFLAARAVLKTPLS